MPAETVLSILGCLVPTETLPSILGYLVPAETAQYPRLSAVSSAGRDTAVTLVSLSRIVYQC